MPTKNLTSVVGVRFFCYYGARLWGRKVGVIVKLGSQS